MTNPTTAAGHPAADPYLRVREPLGGGWSAQPDQRTLERERLESRAKGTDATAQLLRCFPSWTRALEQLTFATLERLARNEPVDPNDPDAWRSRDAHAQAVLHRHGNGSQCHAPDSGGDHGADRRPGGRPTATPDLTGAPLLSRRACSTSAWRAHTHGCRSTSTTRTSGPTSSTSGACSPDRSARRAPSGRPVALAARQPQPVRRRQTCAAGGSAREPGCRSPASGCRGRQRRPAGRRVRRAGAAVERRVAAHAGARARHDPADRRARRPARTRSALGGHPDRPPRCSCSSGSTSTRCTPGRRSA